jgi:hypothetical protein
MSSTEFMKVIAEQLKGRGRDRVPEEEAALCHSV